MAVKEESSKVIYTLNATAERFPIPFDTERDDYGDAKNIDVYLGTVMLERGKDFLIESNTVIYKDAVNHGGEQLTVLRNTPVKQDIDFVDNGSFSLEDIEKMGDNAVRILQELKTNLGDTINAQFSAERAAASAASASAFAAGAAASASAAQGSRTESQTFAHDSEAYAVGTRGGVPVPEGDKNYNNNCKHFYDMITQHITGGVRYKGFFNTEGATDFSALPLPALAGDMYRVIGSAEILGFRLNTGDYIMFNTDVPAGTAVTTAVIDHFDNTEPLYVPVIFSGTDVNGEAFSLNLLTSAVQEVYGGAYTVTPTHDTQELETEGTYLTDNITAEPIPVSEVTDADGGTTITI